VLQWPIEVDVYHLVKGDPVDRIPELLIVPAVYDEHAPFGGILVFTGRDDESQPLTRVARLDGSDRLDPPLLHHAGVGAAAATVGTAATMVARTA